MRLLRKLDNPFILAAQGFLVGAIVFLTANPGTLHALAKQQAAPTAEYSDSFDR